MTNEQKLAEAFAEIIREWTAPHEFAEIRKRNRTYDEGVCATHDFLDANDAMAEAFRQVFEREVRLPCDAEAGDCTQAESDADLKLWNAAWDIAKRESLTATGE
ncbi:MAG TPA: hypothetical protein VF077_07335 [Nitrospiraceae bacterium]